MSIGHFESMALERKRQDTFGIMWGFFGSTYGDHFANQSYESLVSFLVYLPIFPPLMIQIKRQILALRNFEKFPVVVVLL